MAMLRRECLLVIQHVIVLVIFISKSHGKGSSVSYNSGTGVLLFGSNDLGWANIVVTDLYAHRTVNGELNSECHPAGVSSNVRTSTSDTDCVKVEIESTRSDIDAGICFDFGQAMWYGGSELQYQRWPIQNNISLPWQLYTTNDIVPSNQTFGNVLERYWLNSKGVGIYIDEGVPLHATIFDHSNGKNEPRMCLFARNRPQATESHPPSRTINLHMCLTENILQTHQLMTHKFFNYPEGHPDERMMKSPIWSTWAKYKTDISEDNILQYASEIVEHGFSNSQLEIDDIFSTRYGDFDFDPIKFTDPKRMINKLKELGFRVTVWITPFANEDSVAFKEGLEEGYWLLDMAGEKPALVNWWRGVGAILDVEKPEAVDWYLGRLEEMKSSYGVDSFKFDAGELTFVPEEHEYLTKWTDPTMYTTKYVKAVSRMGPMIEVRTYISVHVTSSSFTVTLMFFQHCLVNSMFCSNILFGLCALP